MDVDGKPQTSAHDPPVVGDGVQQSFGDACACFGLPRGQHVRVHFSFGRAATFAQVCPKDIGDSVNTTGLASFLCHVSNSGGFPRQVPRLIALSLFEPTHLDCKEFPRPVCPGSPQCHV